MISASARWRRKLLKKYGLTEESFQERMREQGGKCAICGCDPPLGKTTSRRKYPRLDIDHCHKTGKVRGLLCYNCNIVLGSARDNVEVLEKAIAYLRRHQ